jgi:hypothetical protein
MDTPAPAVHAFAQALFVAVLWLAVRVRRPRIWTDAVVARLGRHAN